MHALGAFVLAALAVGRGGALPLEGPIVDGITTLTTEYGGHATTLTITYDSPIPTTITTTVNGQPTTFISTIYPFPPSPPWVPGPPSSVPLASFIASTSTLVTVINGTPTTLTAIIDPLPPTPPPDTPVASFTASTSTLVTVINGTPTTLTAIIDPPPPTPPPVLYPIRRNEKRQWFTTNAPDQSDAGTTTCLTGYEDEETASVTVPVVTVAPAEPTETGGGTTQCWTGAAKGQPTLCS
ncbi:hypothetical protein C8Q76DRAFT_802847 [Earliella scabrosa]|nr:hypothetical protein C8Q76DRAFT_802847 [Earliella scabrosa]